VRRDGGGDPPRPNLGRVRILGRVLRAGRNVRGRDPTLAPSSPRILEARFSTIAFVAYDQELADRIRELVSNDADVTEQQMFGGLAFLIRGNMAVAASGQGGVLVRVDPASSDRLVATTPAQPMEMRGRAMQGWLRVDDDDVRTKRQLASWVKRGTTYARSLPAKKKR
jgi:TfoX/Sxy family transcriptional regulator of competence genes